jgi:proline dehydrogenase
LERVSAGAALSDDERAEWKRVEARFHGLCRAAKAKALAILVDAEDSWIQPALDALCLDAMRELNRERAVVFNTIQLYRTDRLAFLQKLYDTAKTEGFHVGAKLVRGAYMENERARAKSMGYPSPIHASKAATDQDFDATIAFCLEHLDRVALFAGTHNETSTRLMTEIMAKRGLAPGDDRVTSAQLLSMGDHLTFNLAHAGYNAAKYVPYGPVEAVMPYLFRRVEENSSIKGQATRELQLIERELARRATAGSGQCASGSLAAGKTSRGTAAGR